MSPDISPHHREPITLLKIFLRNNHAGYYAAGGVPGGEMKNWLQTESDVVIAKELAGFEMAKIAQP